MKYLNRLFSSLLIVTLILSSCKDDSEVILEPEQNVEETSVVLKDDILSFNSKESFDQFLMEIENTTGIETSSYISSFESFPSLAKAMDSYQTKLKSSSDDDLTDEQILTMINECLVPDEAMHQILNDERQVEIDGLIYQVTECGTFIYKRKDYQKFQDRYNNFLEEIALYKNVEDNVYEYNGIKIADTFDHLSKGYVNIDEFLAEIGFNYEEAEIIDEKSNSLKSTTASEKKKPIEYADPKNTTKYKLRNYKSGAKTWVGKRIQALVGSNSWRNVNIDGRHRINVKLYDYNYGLFQKAGIKAKHQYLKHYKVRKYGFFGKKTKLFSTYVKDKADEMVVCFEHFLAHTDYEDFGLSEQYYYQRNAYIAKRALWSDAGTKIMQTGFVRPSKNLITGWASNMLFYDATINVAGYDVTGKMLFDFGLNQGVDYINGQMRSKFQSIVDDNYPKATTVWTLGKPNRRYIVLTGLYTYKNKESFSCVIGGSPSFGVGYDSNKPEFIKKGLGAYAPNQSRLDEACIFVAAKKNGKWAGVRMYTE